MPDVVLRQPALLLLHLLEELFTSTSSLTSCFVTLKKFAPGKKHQDILSHRKLSVSRSSGRLVECSPQESPWKSCLLRLALKYPCDVATRSRAREGNPAGKSSQSTAKWSYRCHPVITIPRKPPSSFGSSCPIKLIQLRLLVRCLLESGTTRVSPWAPLNALAVHMCGNT